MSLEDIYPEGFYSIRGVAAVQAAAGADRAIATLWNPHATKRLRVYRYGLVITGTAPASSNYGVRRASARGTPGSSITAGITHSFDRGGAPGSGVILDLASYTAQPTFEAGYLLLGWQHPIVLAAGLEYPINASVEIPPNSGLSLVTIDATNAFPSCHVYFEWRE